MYDGKSMELTKSQGSQHLLFVDDDLKVQKGVNRIFLQRSVPWQCTFVSGVDEAFTVLEKREVDAVIADICMPGKDGFELLAGMRGNERWSGVPIVMLTGLEDPGLKSRALDLGATDLLNKPVNTDELMARIRSVLQLKQYQDTVRLQNRQLERLLQQRTAALEATQVDVIWRLAKAAEFRNNETGNHVIRVGYYARVLAEQLGLGPEFTELLFLTSPLHDIGKIGIPDSILLKKDGLTLAEWQVMKRHCQIGRDLLTEDFLPEGVYQRDGIAVSGNVNPFLEMAADIASGHHEKWLGGGYPFSLCGEDIPLAARIVTICDVYDALRSRRSYKEAFSHAETMKIMSRDNHLRFDPELFAAFEKAQSLFLDIINEYRDDPR